ncbi:kinase-like domain-containing protein [Blastocladiella britannica]|nr:kinase-like domain-containing protein [Blastocladiella britannica]
MSQTSPSASPTRSKTPLSAEPRIGDFKLGKTIGQGAFSKVKLGYHRETGQKVAVKIVDKVLMAEKINKSAKRKEKLKSDAVKKERDRRTSAAPVPAPVNQHITTELIGRLGLTPEGAKPVTESPETDGSPAPLSRGDSIPVISPISSPLPNKDTAVSLVDTLYAEVKLLMRLHHPNIIGLYQVIDGDDECFIIMEYAPGGELIDYIAAKDHLTEREARRFFRQILSAIDHCHQANVVHRDMKLENLLLSESRDILITDFGLGRTFRSDQEDLMMTFCGTPNYAAIELISFKPYVGIHTDIWAMGVILFIMCSGKPPFHGHSIPSLYNKIMNLQYTCPSYFSDDLRRLLARILVKEPKERISINEMYEDPWVNFEEIERPLRLPPLYDNLRETGSDQILSITKDAQCTTFSFSRYHVDVLSKVVRDSATGSSNSSRRSSLRQGGLGGGGGSTDDTGGSDVIRGAMTLGRRMSAVSAGVGRRMSLTRGMGSPTSGAAMGAAPSATATSPTRRLSLMSTSPTRIPTPIGQAPGGLVSITESGNALADTASGARGDHIHRPPGLGAAVLPAGGAGEIPASRSMDFRRVRRQSFTAGMPAAANGSPQPGVVGRSVSPGPAGTAAATPPGHPSNINRSLDPFNEATRTLPGTGAALSLAQSLLAAQNNSSGSAQAGAHESGLTTAISPSGSPRRMSLVTKGDSILYSLGNAVAAQQQQQHLQQQQQYGDGAGFQASSSTGAMTVDLDASSLTTPSAQAIADFHTLHRPPKSIRSMRFALTTTNTSSMPPSAVFQELHRALLAVTSASFPGLTFARDPEFYVFQCRVPLKGSSFHAAAPLSPSGLTMEAGASSAPDTSGRTTTSTSTVDAAAGAGPGQSHGQMAGSGSVHPAAGPHNPVVSLAAMRACVSADKGAAEVITFEAEVCKVWLLNLHGVRIKRISGDPLAFKEVYKTLTDVLSL